jgi:hypothetical protein
MTDPKRTDHWDLIASELGAEPASEQHEENPGPAAEQPATVVPERPREQPVRRPKRPQADWDALAGTLGVAPEPAEVLAEPAEETVTGQRRPEQPDQAPAADRPVEVFQQAEPVIELSAASPFQPLDWLAEEAAELSPAGVEPSVEPGVEPAEKKSTRRRRKRRRKPRDSDAAKVAAQPAATLPTVEGPEDELEEPAQVQPQRDEDRPQQDRSKRRRRRPGARRKKTPSGQGAVAEEAELPAERPPEVRKEPKQPPARVAEPPDDLDELDSEDDDDRVSRPSHRAIPTWEEAIGLIVSANLESRAKNPGGSSRGWGRGRGPSKGQRS